MQNAPKMRHDYVLVKDIKPSEMKGGLVLPDSCQEKGRVRILAVGPDITDLEVGNLATCDPKAGACLTVDGEDVRIVKSEHIYMVLEQ